MALLIRTLTGVGWFLLEGFIVTGCASFGRGDIHPEACSLIDHARSRPSREARRGIKQIEQYLSTAG